MKTSTFTLFELLSLLVSSAVGLFPGEWSTARITLFLASVGLAIVVLYVYFVGSRTGSRKAGTVQRQYLHDFTQILIRDFRDKMGEFGDEVAETAQIERVFGELLQRVDNNVQEVCELERLTASTGTPSLIYVDALAAKRGLEAVRKTLNDEFNDFCPHSYVHPVKRPVRVHETVLNLKRILKSA